ncbi:MAG: hypothetical protein E2604_05225 [Flavobacterium sp.]|nr:hypothetical protein [Flavobacterium sp.]
MDKGIRKNKKYTYSPEIISALVEKHSLTAQYIRQCLSGTRNSITADKIRKDYQDLKTDLRKTFENFKKAN